MIHSRCLSLKLRAERAGYARQKQDFADGSVDRPPVRWVQRITRPKREAYPSPASSDDKSFNNRFMRWPHQFPPLKVKINAVRMHRAVSTRASHSGVSSSNLSPEDGCRDWGSPCFYSVYPGICRNSSLNEGHRRFFPLPFKSIHIHELSFTVWTADSGCCWVALNEASQVLRPFSDLLCVPIWVLIPLIHPPVLSGCTRDICQLLKEVAKCPWILLT
jgi:hypothetical protein